MRAQSVTYFVVDVKWRYNFIRFMKGASYFLFILHRRFFANVHALVPEFFLLELLWQLILKSITVERNFQLHFIFLYFIKVSYKSCQTAL